MKLSADQERFLAECEKNFSDRYTTADKDFNKVHEGGIPPPPIINNWYPRHRRQTRPPGRHFREFGGEGNRFNHRRDHEQHSNDEERFRDRSPRGFRYRANKLSMGYMESINYVLYDNPLSQGTFNMGKSLLKWTLQPIANLAKGTETVHIVKEMQPLWMAASEQGPFVRVAGISGSLAVALAAYAAHKKYPKDQVEELKSVADTANKMHFFHSIALMAVPLTRNPRTTGGLFITGTLLFSGPCYYYAFTGKNNFRELAPIGGTILIMAWLSMIF